MILVPFNGLDTCFKYCTATLHSKCHFFVISNMDQWKHMASVHSHVH